MWKCISCAECTSTCAFVRFTVWLYLPAVLLCKPIRNPSWKSKTMLASKSSARKEYGIQDYHVQVKEYKIVNTAKWSASHTSSMKQGCNDGQILISVTNLFSNFIPIDKIHGIQNLNELKNTTKKKERTNKNFSMTRGWEKPTISQVRN